MIKIIFIGLARLGSLVALLTAVYVSTTSDGYDFANFLLLLSIILGRQGESLS